jgi:hypothetical protein
MDWAWVHGTQDVQHQNVQNSDGQDHYRMAYAKRWWSEYERSHQLNKGIGVMGEKVVSAWILRGRMQDNRLHINEKFNIKLSCLKLQQQF